MSSDGIYWHELMFYHLKTSCYYRYGLTSHEWEFVTKGVIAIETQTNNELSRVHNIYREESIQLLMYPVQTHCVK